MCVYDCLGTEQIINEPTRTTASSLTVIDLILTTNSSAVLDKGVIPTHNLSDHDLVYCKINATIKYQNKEITHRDYKNLNHDLFNIHLKSLPIFHVIKIENFKGKICLFK